MDIDISASDILYIIGIILGISAIVFFGREIIADLSPTIKSFVLLIAFPSFLISGNLIHKKILDNIFYILSVLSYLVFLWYSFDAFNLGNNMVFLALVISSVLFIGMGYLWEKGTKIEHQWKRGVLAVLLISMVALVVFDVLGPQPTYELNFQERVSFEGAWDGEEKEIPIGTLQIKNDFLFSRYTDTLYLNACLYTPEKHYIYLDYPAWKIDMIGGKSTENIKISLRPPTEYDGDVKPIYMENIETLPIETASSCPAEVDEPKLVISISESFR